MRDGLSTYHPLVSGCYFALILGVTVTTFHPILLLLALIPGFCWAKCLGGAPSLGVMVVLFVLTALINPLFSHKGVTTLAYFPNGNPLTLESILYGLGAGGMLVCALVWFGCMSRVMGADKWMCLLGRAAPALALLLSMVLRALPRLRHRLAQTAQAQRQVGRRGDSPLQRARQGVTVLSVLLSWSLEDGILTADSMDARGYGLLGRTNYTNYRLSPRDRTMLVGLGCGGGYLLLMALQGGLLWRYYPSLVWRGLHLCSLSAFFVWGLLCALPLYLTWKEARPWTSSP